MSSSRAMASAQQKRVTMQKSIAPANNSNPRRSIASRGRFNNSKRNQVMTHPSPQLQQPQLQHQYSSQLLPQSLNTPLNTQNNLNYNTMSFQSDTPLKSNKKIHVNQAVSLLSQKIAHLERLFFDENAENNININCLNKQNTEIDNSVLTAIIERIENLEKRVQTFISINDLNQIKELINSNTKAIEVIQKANDEYLNNFDNNCQDNISENSNNSNNSDDDNDDDDETNSIIDTYDNLDYNQNVNLIIENVNDDDISYHNSNFFEKNRLFVKPTF